jgi:hypothetical protein
MRMNARRDAGGQECASYEHQTERSHKYVREDGHCASTQN